MAFLHFQIRQPRKLKKTLWVSVRSAISDRWAVVLGQLCPFYVSPVVAAFKLQATNPANTTSPQQIVEILRYLCILVGEITRGGTPPHPASPYTRD